MTRRPQEGVAGRKSLLVGEDKSLDVRAHETGGDSSGEKSRRSWVMETPRMSLHREEPHCCYPRAILPDTVYTVISGTLPLPPHSARGPLATPPAAHVFLQGAKGRGRTRSFPVGLAKMGWTGRCPSPVVDLP